MWLNTLIPIEKSLRDVEKSLAEYRSWFEKLDDNALMGVEKTVSAWSPADHIVHIQDATAYMFRFLVKTIDGSWESQGGTLKFPGHLCLVLNWIPRGRGRSPFPVPDEITRELMAGKMAELDQQLAAIREGKEALKASGKRCKHAVFGTMDAVQFTRFVEVHAHHHRKIVKDIFEVKGVRV